MVVSRFSGRQTAQDIPEGIFGCLGAYNRTEIGKRQFSGTAKSPVRRHRLHRRAQVPVL